MAPSSDVCSSSLSSFLHLGHLVEGGDDMSDDVVVIHVMEVEVLELNALIKIANNFHVLEFRDDRIFEALLEQVILALLDATNAGSLNLYILELFKLKLTLHIQFLSLKILFGLLFGALLVNIGDVGSEISLKHLKLQSELVLPVAKLILTIALLGTLCELAVFLELLNFAPSLFQILSVASLVGNQVGVEVSLASLYVLFKFVKID